MNRNIPLCEPEIRGNEWRYIKECLDTNWVSSAGRFVDRFESSLAKYIGSHFSVACTNGTAALHTALKVSGIKKDEEVLLPAVTFIAPANAVRYVGAWPVFMDVDPQTWQMDTQKLEDFLKKECGVVKGCLVNKATRRKIRIVLPVHILGHPVDMDPILKIAKKYGLIVIEDAAESLGAVYRGRKVGSLGDISCLSFNGNKIITTGAGGMLLTNKRAWAEKARYLTTQAKDNPLEYIHKEIGFNYRISNIQAAMGVAQLEKLKSYIKIKRLIAARYKKGLSSVKGITLPNEASWAKSTYWLYTILVDAVGFGMNSRKLLSCLQKMNIQSRPLWHPLHSLKLFKGCLAYRVEVANRLYRDALSIPSSVGLSNIEQESVIEAISKLQNG